VGTVGVWGNGWKKSSDANHLRKTLDSPNMIQNLKKKKVNGEKISKLLGNFEKTEEIKLVKAPASTLICADDDFGTKFGKIVFTSVEKFETIWKKAAERPSEPDITNEHSIGWCTGWDIRKPDWNRTTMWGRGSHFRFGLGWVWG
jgi:hypothetical protein